MFTGKPPFAGAPDPAVQNSVCNGNRPLRPSEREVARLGLDDGLWSIVQRCWDRDPSVRLPADRLCNELDKLVKSFHGKYYATYRNEISTHLASSNTARATGDVRAATHQQPHVYPTPPPHVPYTQLPPPPPPKQRANISSKKPSRHREASSREAKIAPDPLFGSGPSADYLPPYTPQAMPPDRAYPRSSRPTPRGKMSDEPPVQNYPLGWSLPDRAAGGYPQLDHVTVKSRERIAYNGTSFLVLFRKQPNMRYDADRSTESFRSINTSRVKIDMLAQGASPTRTPWIPANIHGGNDNQPQPLHPSKSRSLAMGVSVASSTCLIEAHIRPTAEEDLRKRGYMG